jgi:hypothetical protein
MSPETISEAPRDEVDLRNIMATFEHQFPGLAQQIKDLTTQRLGVLLMMGTEQRGSSGSSTEALETLE